jgi:hypothetical protein
MKIRHRNRIRRPALAQVARRWLRQATRQQLQDRMNRRYRSMLASVAMR